MANGQSLCNLSAKGSDKRTVVQLKKLGSNSFFRFLSFLTVAVDFKLKSFFLLALQFFVFGGVALLLDNEKVLSVSMCFLPQSNDL